MKKTFLLFIFLGFSFSGISFAANEPANITKPQTAVSSGELFKFKDIGFVISSTASSVTGEKGAQRLQLILQHPVAFIISNSEGDDGKNSDLDKISLVPSGLEKEFLLKKDSVFYIGNRDLSPDAYLMFLDEDGKKTAERVDVEKVQFNHDQMTAVVELESPVPDYLVGHKNTKSMALFIISASADIATDTAVYSQGKVFGALMFGMLDQKGKNTPALLQLSKKTKRNFKF